MSDVLEFTTEGEVAVITLNRPDQRNCIDQTLNDAIGDAVRAFEADPALRVGILAGRGKVFCAGMDLKAFTEGDVTGMLLCDGRLGRYVSYERTKPMIAAVQGAALAGGMELMLACDFAIAERSAKFGLPEARLGLLAGAGGVFRLAQRLPPAKAKELILTGRMFTAEEADSYGLLTRVVEPGAALDSAIDLAREIAKSAPQSVRDSLKLANMVEAMQAEALWQMNDRLMLDILKSADAMEGATAFKEKRAPVWQTGV